MTTVDLFMWFKSTRFIYEKIDVQIVIYDMRSGVGISEVRFLYLSLKVLKLHFHWKFNIGNYEKSFRMKWLLFIL